MEPTSGIQEQRPSGQNHGGKENSQSMTCKSRMKVDRGIRAWFHLTSTGHARSMDVGKQAIMRRTGLSARDLRILDPILAYPLVVIGRRRAVVVNLEYIKGVIMAKDVWMLNAKDPAVTPFVESLKRLVMSYHRDVTKVVPIDIEDNVKRSEEGEGKEIKLTAADNQERPPFEFMVLEACLEDVSTSLDTEVETLEKESYPTLDEPNLNITNLTIDCIRQIKSRLLVLNIRVQKIKDEIEHLLGDDDRMAEMCLTNKLRLQERSDKTSVTADDNDNEGDDSDDRIDEVEPKDNPAESLDSSIGEIRHAKVTTFMDSGNKHHQAPELEKILEAYLVRIDASLSKVSKLKEHVHNMEDYLKLMLDDKQNSLLQMTIHVRTVSVVMTVYILFTGLLAMNIQIPLWQQEVVSNKNMLWVNGAAMVFTIISYLFLVVLYKYKSWLI